MRKEGYSPEIDGLRAVAILSVVAYHAGVPGISAGFAGVDVFFVISGFLITDLLLEELDRCGTIDLLEFFSRRARRLFPALFVVIAATLVLGAFFLLPLDREQVRLAHSAAAALLYVSNFYFAQSSGYFDTPAESAPLLHTWSLAVEEQFYILWPCALIGLALLARRLAPRRPAVYLRHLIAASLVLVLCASLLYSAAAAHGTTAQAAEAFYLITSRAWELGTGALFALARSSWRTVPRWTAELIGVAGLGAILASITIFDSTVPYPGTAAALPVLGAVAVLASVVSGPQTAVARLLASPPLVGIGLVSYSWYLWHWPLLAISRLNVGGDHDLSRDVMICLAALGLAAATYVLIENPVRRRRVYGGWSAATVLRAAAAAGACLITVGEAVAFWGEHAARAENSPYLKYLRAAQHSQPTCRSTTFDPARTDPCVRRADLGRPYVLLWGDSHARHLRPLLESSADVTGFGIVQRTWAACPPLLAATPMSGGRLDRKCAAFNRNVLSELKQLKRAGLTSVVLSARWSIYGQQHRISVVDRNLDKALVREGVPGVSTLEALNGSLRETVAALTALGLRVLIVAPIPEQRFRVPSCLARRSVEHCSILRTIGQEYRSGPLDAVVRAASISADARVFDPFPLLCPDHLCRVERDGVILYHDDDHLSADGARSLLPAFLPLARWLAPPEPAQSSQFENSLAASSRAN